jgi:hypothetical protein
MSEYDNITTADDLVREVMQNGLSTTQEDLNRAADIIGQTSVGDLEALAKNKAWKLQFDRFAETARALYAILHSIWGYDEFCRFYARHALGLFDEIAEANEKFCAEKEVNRELLAQCNHAREAIQAETSRKNEVLAELEAAEAQVLRLKAKLYDQMTAGD